MTTFVTVQQQMSLFVAEATKATQMSALFINIKLPVHGRQIMILP